METINEEEKKLFEFVDKVMSADESTKSGTNADRKANIECYKELSSMAKNISSSEQIAIMDEFKSNIERINSRYERVFNLLNERRNAEISEQAKLAADKMNATIKQAIYKNPSFKSTLGDYCAKHNVDFGKRKDVLKGLHILYVPVVIIMKNTGIIEINGLIQFLSNKENDSKIAQVAWEYEEMITKTIVNCTDYYEPDMLDLYDRTGDAEYGYQIK